MGAVFSLFHDVWDSTGKTHIARGWNHLERALANYGLQAKSALPPVSGSRIVLEQATPMLSMDVFELQWQS